MEAEEEAEAEAEAEAEEEEEGNGKEESVEKEAKKAGAEARKFPPQNSSLKKNFEELRKKRKRLLSFLFPPVQGSQCCETYCY